VAAHELVAVLEVGEHGRDERLQQLGFGEAAEEPQRDAPDVLFGAMQAVAEVLADEYHLQEDSSGAGAVTLVDGLEVEEEQLLDGVVIARLHVADHSDEEVWKQLAVEEERDGAPHRVGFHRAVAGLKLGLDLVRIDGVPLSKCTRNVHGFSIAAASSARDDRGRGSGLAS
jgi:hypothetical protein